MLEEGCFAPRDGEWDTATPRAPGARPQAIPVSAPVTPGLGSDGWDAASPPSAPAREVPVPRGSAPTVQVSTAPKAHRALEQGLSLERRAQETCLRCETLVEADKVTLYVSPALAAEARVGEHVLTLRRLTIRASTLRLVARTDGLDDLSLSARGHVRFRSDRPASILDEQDLKSLLVHNEGYTPLR